MIARRTGFRGWLALQTVPGELFSIVKPDVNDERLEMLRAIAREVLEEDRAVKDDGLSQGSGR